MGVQLVIRAAWRIALLATFAAVLAATPARATVTLTTSRGEALYSADGDPSCSDLSKLADDKLPLNVIRIRANVGGATGPVRYRWSVPRPQVGTLAADLDLGPSEETAVVRALCSDFGNACVLTPDKLPFYNRPTILWIAPPCEVLPDKVTAAYRGGTLRMGVTVTEGSRKLGKATTDPIGFGRSASVTLFVNGRDGNGIAGGVPSGVNPYFGAIVAAPGLTLPSGGEFEFDSGGGASETVASCTDGTLRGDVHSYDACAARLLYAQAGKYIASVKQTFDDGSALCDRAAVHVLSATIVPRLTVATTPRGAFGPGDPSRGTVHLKVTLHNDSPQSGGSGIVLVGSNVLTCSSELVIAGSRDSRQTSFDLQHCSDTTAQGCRSDAECRSPYCSDCGADETCLLESHCSTTLDQPCNGDTDCTQPACQECEDGETCVHVLATPSIVVDVGQQVDLIDKDVAVSNLFTVPAKVVDGWTVNTFNAGTADAKVKYKIVPGAAAP